MILTSKIKDDLINKIKNRSIINQLVTTIIVDNNVNNITSFKIKKINGITTIIKSVDSKKLIPHNIIVKETKSGNIIISDEVGCEQTILNNKKIYDCISLRINREFVSLIETFKNLEVTKWKFLNPNFLERIFLNRNNFDLISKIIEIGSTYNWIIVNKDVLDIIKKSNFYEETDIKSKSFIKNVGYIKFDNITIKIYLNNNQDNNKIFFGAYESISIVINKDIIVNKLDTTENNYSIQIDYLFVENDTPIKCLIL